MRCVGGVLSQRVAACRVETTLRSRWAPPIELVGGVSVWVEVEVVTMVMMIRAFLFAPLFARFAQGAASLTATMQAYDLCVCSCVFVCVRAFAPYLPTYLPYLPGLGTNARTGVSVVVKRSLWTLTTMATTTFGWVWWVVRMRG